MSAGSPFGALEEGKTVDTRIAVLVAVLALGLVGCPEEEVADDDTTTPDDDSGDDDSASAVDADGDGWGEDEDCDDGDPTTYPGADELCDGIDNDCDGMLLWRERDNDSDGIMSCEGDCDDNNPAAGPGFEEVCDGIDNDCDTTNGADHHCNPRYTDTADAILSGDSWRDDYGFSIAFAGDVNADGFDDIVVGAPQDDIHYPSSGYVAFYYSPVYGEVMYEDADALILGVETEGFVGWSVASAGDTNADGYDDLVLSSPPSLFLGPLSGDGDVTTADAEFEVGGCSVAPLGDIDTDGFDDVILGSCGVSRTHVFRGPLLGYVAESDAVAWFVGEDPMDYSGDSVASAGDVNADGETDVLIGAPRDGSSGLFTGAGYLVYGPFAGEHDLGQDRVKFLGESSDAHAGSSVARAGDTNGDGFDDVLVGSPCGVVGGAAYLFHGPVLLGDHDLADADAVMTGIDGGYNVGTGLARAGDLNADGLEDVLVGAPGSDTSDTGGAAVFFGPLAGPMTTDDADYRIRGGPSAGDSVAGLGDADGDGLNDLLVGYPGADSVYLFYGASR